MTPRPATRKRTRRDPTRTPDAETPDAAVQPSAVSAPAETAGHRRRRYVAGPEDPEDADGLRLAGARGGRSAPARPSGDGTERGERRREAANGTEAASDAAGEPPAGEAVPAAAGTALVAVVRGVPRYHEADCVLIRFMPEGDVQKLTIPQAREEGCTPCAACQPEG